MPSLEELRERFREDRYATQLTGADILEAEPGRALVGLRLRPDHLNANQKVMGGAVFTLADFAFAVAANGFAERITVSQHVSITFLAPAKGQELLAKAREMLAELKYLGVPETELLALVREGENDD